MKKALIAYSSKPPIAEYMSASFQKIGVECRVIFADQNHWFDKYVIHTINKQLHNFRILPKSKALFSLHPLAHKNFRSERLKKAFDEFDPDVTIAVRGIGFTKECLEYVGSKKPLFGWWVEKEERVEEALSEIALFGKYFFINSSCVEAALARGFQNASLLCHSVDLNSFYKIENETKKYDICFVGNWSLKRQKTLEAMLAVTDNIAIFGAKWRKKNLFKPRVLRCVKGSYIGGQELNLLYNQSKIVLNVTNWGFGEGDKRSGVNMRTLEVPATGSFLLTDGSRDLKKLIEAGKHIAVYDSLEDCVQKAAYYLALEDERELIAKEGHKFVRESHGYDNLVGEIAKAYKTFIGA